MMRGFSWKSVSLLGRSSRKFLPSTRKLASEKSDKFSRLTWHECAYFILLDMVSVLSKGLPFESVSWTWKLRIFSPTKRKSQVHPAEATRCRKSSAAASTRGMPSMLNVTILLFFHFFSITTSCTADWPYGPSSIFQLRLDLSPLCSTSFASPVSQSWSSVWPPGTLTLSLFLSTFRVSSGFSDNMEKTSLPGSFLMRQGVGRAK
mmetsp:Transcript_7234/g.15775  ORF Transcript_7234/g.15775 Transcript_7234/m.15775 type:complete len:205 (+) Transcript_7234:318-932(+)